MTLTQSLAPTATAVLSGTPSTAQGGIYNFSVTATNSGNFTVTNDYTLTVFAPTAAAVTIGGRVLAANGRGIFGTQLLLIAPNGAIRYARTNPFGFYRFAEVATGEIYTINVFHKNRIVAPRVISATADLSDFNFIAALQN